MTTRVPKPPRPDGEPRKPKALRPPRRAPKTVPVASRDRERERAALQGQPEKQRFSFRAKSKPALFQQDVVSTGILLSVVLVVLVAIAVPLRNYYEGRGEIARATASIEALEAQKHDLETEIARYEDPAYLEQEARRRLGVLAEGETAWRIIDPRMTQGPAITTDEVPDDRVWHEVLWDSLRELPEAQEKQEVQEVQDAEEAPAPEEPAP